jgi:hypothetical protein
LREPAVRVHRVIFTIFNFLSTSPPLSLSVLYFFTSSSAQK